MNHKIQLLFGLLLFFFLACEQVSTIPIHGEWQAYEVSEEGDSMRLDPSEIKFHFLPSGTYHFQGTVGHEEAGRYRVHHQLLYTTDTLQKTSEEKVVAIAKLTLDSLTIRMEANGKEQLIKLKK